MNPNVIHVFPSLCNEKSPIFNLRLLGKIIVAIKHCHQGNGYFCIYTDGVDIC